jgi:hypothetical protein
MNACPAEACPTRPTGAIRADWVIQAEKAQGVLSAANFLFNCNSTSLSLTDQLSSYNYLHFTGSPYIMPLPWVPTYTRPYFFGSPVM